MRKESVKRIKFEDLGLSLEERLKLPSRRELSSRPWSDDQMRTFIERQKHVPDILAEKGIRIIRTVSYQQLKEECRSGDLCLPFSNEKQHEHEE